MNHYESTKGMLFEIGINTKEKKLSSLVELNYE